VLPVGDTAQSGDKVLVKRGEHKGIRGRIEDVTRDGIAVRLDMGKQVVLKQEDITNYSLAARRAWTAMPDRAVGRPKLPETARKKTVSLRIDVEVWRELGEAVNQDLIPSREYAVNMWLREQVNLLLNRPDKHDATSE